VTMDDEQEYTIDETMVFEPAEELAEFQVVKVVPMETAVPPSIGAPEPRVVDDDERKRLRVKERLRKDLQDKKKRKEASERNAPTPVCPDCGEGMILRTNRHNGIKFYGCRMFPKCRGTRSL